MDRMLVEFVEKIEELAGPAPTIVVDGQEFHTRQLRPVMAPQVEPVKVNTLTGLVDLLKAKVEEFEPGGSLVHVENFDSVKVITRESDGWQRRDCLVHATLKNHGEGFHFGQKYGAEAFNIALQTLFVDRPTRAELLRLVGNLKSAELRTAEDDGVSQIATLRAGVHLAGEEKIPNPVSLCPWRTFREITQPESLFVFRLHGGDDGLPSCSLLEADGGKWKLDAIQAVAKWLDTELRAAQLTIPVIA